MRRSQKIAASTLLPSVIMLVAGYLLDRLYPANDLPGVYSFLVSLAFPWIALAGLTIAWFVTKPDAVSENS